MGTRRQSGEGSIYPYPHGFRAYVWVTTSTGRRQRKYVSGKTRDEVRAKYLALHQAARKGPVVSSVPTLARYLEEWLADVVRPSLAPKTATNYEIFCRLYIIPGIGSKRLDKLLVRDVQVWLNKLREPCQCCAQGKDAKRRAPRCCAIGRCCDQIPKDWTVHQAWRVLRGALSQAVRDELLTRNVAALVRVPLPRSKVRSSWMVSDARRFLTMAIRCTPDTFSCWSSDCVAENS
jgi:hypothetical protein